MSSQYVIFIVQGKKVTKCINIIFLFVLPFDAQSLQKEIVHLVIYLSICFMSSSLNRLNKRQNSSEEKKKRLKVFLMSCLANLIVKL